MAASGIGEAEGELVISDEADWGTGGLGDFFELAEEFGAEEFFELGGAEVGDGEDFEDFEALVFEEVFQVFGVVVIHGEVFEEGRFFGEGVDVGFFEPVAEHFGEGFFAGDFDDGDAAGLHNAVEFFDDFGHVFKVVGGANHEEAVERFVFEGEVVDVALFGQDFVAVFFLGVGEFGFGVVEDGGVGGAGEVFVGEAAIATGDVDEVIHGFGEEFADGEAVGEVFVVAFAVFPEEFFVIVAVVVGDDGVVGVFGHGLIIAYCARIASAL